MLDLLASYCQEGNLVDRGIEERKKKRPSRIRSEESEMREREKKREIGMHWGLDKSTLIGRIFLSSFLFCVYCSSMEIKLS